MKAQMEILGLVVVIVLILLGLLLFVSFNLNTNEPKPLKNDFIKTQMAQNYINTLMDTTSSCNNMQISKLASECENIHLGFGSNVNCDDGLNPCSEIIKIANITLKDALGMYAYRFSFGIDKGYESEWGNVSSDAFRMDAMTVGSGKAVLPSKIPGQSLYFRLDINR